MAVGPETGEIYTAKGFAYQAEEVEFFPLDLSTPTNSEVATCFQKVLLM